jgi:prepilin-type processing-associated H-X9-DG protein
VILLALGVPAVQKFREAANRTYCQNNLRQIAQACHDFHDVNGKLPAGTQLALRHPPQRPDSGQRVKPDDYWSWLARLLPYGEQEALLLSADEWALQGDGWKTGKDPYFWWPWGDYWDNWKTAKPNPAIGEVIPLYGCPADGRMAGPAPQVQGMSIAFTSYLGVSGTRGDLGGPRSDRNGSLYWKSEVRLTAINDGLGSTLLIGERPPSATYEFGWWFAAPGFDGSGTGDVVLGTRDTAFASALCSDAKVGLHPGDVHDRCAQSHFWSLHPGGANFAFADCSVRFLSHAANEWLPALGTIDGGETIPPFE